MDTTDKKWPILEWYEVAERLAHQTFQVLRQQSSGTAFLCCQGIESNSSFRHYVFTGAWHVIDDLLKDDGFVLCRTHDDAIIECDTNHTITARLGPPEFDLGFIIVRTSVGVLPPEQMMPIRGLKTFPALGDDLAWYGHPGSLGRDPVFCRGSLACFKTNPLCYLINGVAYPGMSGAAVSDQRGWVIGIVSQWWTDPQLPEAKGMLQAAPSAMVRHVLEDRMRARVIEPEIELSP